MDTPAEETPRARKKPSKEEREAAVEQRADAISGGIINAVDTVAAIGSVLFERRPAQDKQPELGASSSPSASSQGLSGADEEEIMAWESLSDQMAAAEEGADEGLSIDEMMAKAREQMGEEEQGAESNDALRAAFEALKEADAAKRTEPTIGGTEVKSSLLKGAASLGFELRSFLEGAKRDLEGVQNQAGLFFFPPVSLRHHRKRPLAPLAPATPHAPRPHSLPPSLPPSLSLSLAPHPARQPR